MVEPREVQEAMRKAVVLLGQLSRRTLRAALYIFILYLQRLISSHVFIQ